MRDTMRSRGLGTATTVALLCAAGALLPARLAAEDLRDLVDEVLDQKIENVQIDGLPLPEALTKLGDKTGLSFVMDRAAVDWMPYGERTKVSIDLRDVTVRQGLRRMFAGLGLAMRMDADKIVVEPAPVLDRLGQRMTLAEVQLLGTLASKAWADLPAESRAVQFRGLPQDAQRALDGALAQVKADSAVEQLEAATQNLGWCWVPEDGTILMYSRAEDLRRRLERPIDLSYQGVPLDGVLVDLGQRVGVPISFQPGVLDRIQAGRRKLDLVHRGTTLQQTLERICGSAGIRYQVSDAGVAIGLPEGQGGGPALARGRVVAILRVPVGADGTTIEYPFYEDSLPPEFQRLLERKLPVVLEELRRTEGGGGP